MVILQLSDIQISYIDIGFDYNILWRRRSTLYVYKGLKC